MALKFLNKKGWHTGSLRNIENVWKAEQKNDAEQKKLEELRKQIQEERERSEFRQLQEQAGLVPRQERLDFLYDSGLAVGKGSSSSAAGGSSGVAFKALEEVVPPTTENASASAAASSTVLGALFEDKPHSANDAWRKLHSDPLLLIRQREQEALARIKNNPVQMAIIQKSVEASKEEKAQNKKHHQKKNSHRSKKHHKHSSSEERPDSEDFRVERDKTRNTSNSKRPKYDDECYKARVVSDEKSSKRESETRKHRYKGSNDRDLTPNGFSDFKAAKHDDQDVVKKNHDKFKSEKHLMDYQTDPDGRRREREPRSSTHKNEKETRSLSEARSYNSSAAVSHDSHHNGHRREREPRNSSHKNEKETRSYSETRSYNFPAAASRDSHHKHRTVTPKLSEEERAAKLREMQVDAELHEEQRWNRLKKAEEEDAQEAIRGSISGGSNFLDAAQRSMYGTEKEGSSTIEKNVRRRAHYSQGRTETGHGNAFRR
ncbi:uncharacterized protein LOC126676877 [Mercurialis annua]|uniref:uncharacterized protein LOC126676877 n=1 Tax=Mercurialis annua TaxID=3986 RepID=UPI00215DDFEB|nr:uncharacterized protein LOC126676877 [Mercurialis annua]